MTPNSGRCILVAVDLTWDMEAETDAAVARGFALAATLGTTERIHLLYVEKTPVIWPSAPGSSGTIQAMWETLTASATRMLDRLAVPPTHVRVTREVCMGSPTEHILAVSKNIEADLIVIATRSRSDIARFAFGSVASAVVRGADCPVLIVAKDRRGPAGLRKLLVGVDASPVAERVVERAASIARVVHAQVHLVAVLQQPHQAMTSALSPSSPAEPERATLRAHCTAALESHVAAICVPGIELIAKVVEGPTAADSIVEQADHIDADMIVVGSSGHNAWQRLFLGSTATKVIAHAHCSVLVVP